MPSKLTKTMDGDFQKVAVDRVKFIENRTCEVCGKEYPVFEVDGKKTEICINCDNIKIQQDMQQRHENTEKRRIFKLIEKYSYVPDEIKSESFASFDAVTDMEKKALADVKEFVAHFPSEQKILLQGSTGTGKTHLAYAASRELLKQGYVVLFATVPQMLDMVRETFSKNSDISKIDIINWYIKADLLVLDDFGVETVTDKNRGWVAEIVFNIVNGRVDKPTIFTTNLKSKELASKYGKIDGQRIVSRMSKNVLPIELTGKDRRLSSW